MTRVLVTGVFDILHDEHVKFLKKAKSLGGQLIVGLESDARVRNIKGEGRPVNLQAIRQKNLQALKISDQVIILPEKFDSPDDHLRFLQKIKPNILAVSSHTAHLEEKRQLMAEIGGIVVVAHHHNPKVSTTLSLKKTPFC